MVDIFRALTAVVAPPHCQFCGVASESLPICADCRDALPWNRMACPRCALPQSHDAVCAHCLARPPSFDAAWAPFRLEAPIRQQIHALKYRAAFVQARLLGHLLADALMERESVLPDVVLPVPLHPLRLWRRGYNQSIELSRVLQRDAGLRVEPGWTRRLRRTADQIGTDAVARRRNVAQAFSVDLRVAGLRVALLDDVMTTGATLAELARCCRRAGAIHVEAWAIARAP